jgi:hypothetical protein
LRQSPPGATCGSSGASGFGPLGCDPLCRPTFDRCEAGEWATELGLALGGETSDVWAAGNQDVWFAIPAGSVTRIRRAVEFAWIAMPDVGARVEAIWSAPGRVLAGGVDGQLFSLARTPTSPPALVWQPAAFPGAAGETITDLWGTAADDVFATTSNGRIVHWNGLTWQIERPGGEPLRAIHGDGSGAVIAIGDGVIAIRSGASWSSTPAAGGFLDALWVRSPLDAWAVGRDGGNHAYHLQFDGASWQAVPLSPPQPWGPLHGVVARAADDAWIAGGNGPAQLGNGGLLLRYDGGQLELVPSAWQWLSTMSGVDTGDLWGAQYDPFSFQTTAIHQDGTGWRRRPLAPLVGADVIDVVNTPEATWMASATTLVRHDDRRAGRDPARVATLAPPGGFGGAITTLWAFDVDLAFVFVGATAWRYDAGSWSSTTLASPVTDAWGAGGHVFAVGGDRVHHFDGATWSSETHGTNLRAVGGTAVDDVWLAGDGFHRRVGPATYEDLPPPPWPLVTRTIHAVAPGYVVFAGDANGVGFIQAWTGTQWVPQGPLNGPLTYTAVTGSSSSDLWAFGTTGTLGFAAHWDGTTWTPISLPDLASPLRAGSASAVDDVWAAGDGGELIHLDQRLTAITGGACPAAAPVGCSGAGVFAGFSGAVVDGASHYVLDAAFAGTLTTFLASGTTPMQHRILERGPDGTCDVAAPLGTSSTVLQVPLVFGKRYYIEVAPITPGQVGGFELSVGCARN